MIQAVCDALGVSAANVRVTGEGSLPSAFRVTELAVASLVAAAAAARGLVADADLAITVDRELASHWFGMTLRPQGWVVPPLWDAVGGDYRTADGWIRLHTNAPHHRAAALGVLGAPAHREAVAAAVATWTGDDLETAVVDAGGAAAAMRTIEAWRVHPQGRAVQSEPLVQSEVTGPAEPVAFGRDRPLAGVRVLDLTRVLAGPVCTRLLAGLGADVLRIDPPDWDEPGVIPEVLRGKRTARLDLRSPAGREQFAQLLEGADVLVHGYRPGALEGLGFGVDVRDRLGTVDVCLDAYGWSGPWAMRRGFDSLVQMSTGIAAEGMRVFGRGQPTPLPVQALDHATGYLMAAAALRGLALRQAELQASRWRLSLARTASLLIDAGAAGTSSANRLADPALEPVIEQTTWGPALRVAAPVRIDGIGLRWDRPARALGSDEPTW